MTAANRRVRRFTEFRWLTSCGTALPPTRVRREGADASAPLLNYGCGNLIVFTSITVPKVLAKAWMRWLY